MVIHYTPKSKLERRGEGELRHFCAANEAVI